MMRCRLVVVVVVVVVVVMVIVVVLLLFVVVVVVVQTHLAHFLVRDYHEDVAVDQLDTDQ